jgi:tRNA pseudouridine38-40 synthase
MTNDKAQRYIALVIAYDGTDFCGSQRQQNGRSVQGELERALQVVLKHPAPVVLAGRTDSGVHATGQVARFVTDNRIPTDRVPLGLNRVLDQAVRVARAWDVDDGFHPRFSARSRLYRYTIDNSVIANPLLRRYAGHIMAKLDVAAMRAAAPVFIGTHDFAAWQSAGSPTATTVRTVKRLEIRWRRDVFGSSLIEIEVEADAFLYQMVRNLVGALIAVGRGELGNEDLQRLTAGRDRAKCPPPAPPQGLCLVQVTYDNGYIN